MIKKALATVLDQKWTLLGMYFVWIVFEGSARTIASIAILGTALLDIVHNLAKKEDDNGDTKKCSNENCSGNCC